MNQDNDGVIVIHCEYLTDLQRMAIAEAVAEFLNERFPELVQKIVS